MKTKLLVLITIFLVTDLLAQEKLKIGDKAPFINIEHYLQNKPKDTSIKNKYILLEFWATWCKSCLQEVPKINSLAKKYSDRKDIVFISLTDEEPIKTKLTLEKISFKSLVVSDETSVTHKNYISNADGGYSIPKTILIDNKGIIRWVGTTMKLNPELFEKFLANMKIEKSDETFFDIPSPTFTK